MKKIALSIIAISFGIGAQAQNVGIGTATPTEKLHVQGGARVTSLSGVGNRLVQSNATGVLSNVADGPAGMFLTTNGAGGYTWAAPGSATAENGLYVGGGNVRMGGPLIENTTVTLGAYQLTWNMDGLGDFNVQDAGVTTFQVRDDGISFFGDDVYWRDVSVTGTNLMSLIDDGNDGRLQIYENGVTSVDLDANTAFIFNEQGLDRDFRVETVGNANLFFVNAGDNVTSFSGVNAAPYVLGNAIPVHTMYYPIEIGSDGNGGQQVAIGYYRASDPEVNPEQTGGWGYVGYDVLGAGEEWWRMYSNGFINTSQRQVKRDIHTINEDDMLENYLVNTIRNMKPSLYNYTNELSEMQPGLENHFRPAFRIGLIADESPDFILDEGFSGVDIYGLAALSLTGVQHNLKEIDELKASKTIQDFGSEAMNGTEMWISFTEDFGSAIPVVTVTSNNPNVVISVVEKNANQFKVTVNQAVAGLQIDWIAMAKAKSAKVAPALPNELKEKLEVPEATKEQIIEFYENFDSTIGPNGKK